MVASKRLQNAKSEKYHNNIHRRGQVEAGTQKPDKSLGVGPIMLGFLVFVVLGSAVLQIIRAASGL